MQRYEFLKQEFYNEKEYFGFLDYPMYSKPIFPEWAKPTGDLWRALESGIESYGVTNIVPICCNIWRNKNTHCIHHQIRALPLENNTVVKVKKYDVDEYYGYYDGKILPEWAILIPGCFSKINGKIVQCYTNTVPLLQKKIQKLNTNEIIEEIAEIDMEKEIILSRKLLAKKK